MNIHLPNPSSEMKDILLNLILYSFDSDVTTKVYNLNLRRTRTKRKNFGLIINYWDTKQA